MKTLERLRRSNKLISDINVLAFLGVVGVLFCVIMSPYLVIRDVITHDANLPYANHPVLMPGANREDAIIIVVSRDGMIYLNNEKAEVSELPASIQALVKSGSPKVAYFKADARVRYKSVRDALEAARTAGIEKVAFLVWERKDRTMSGNQQ
jgi:biopolymer transport protein ExbD